MGTEIRDVINLGLLPFVLYMAWLFWLALQKSNDKYASLLEKLVQVIENNTRAFRDAEAQSLDVCDALRQHEAHVDKIEDKIDVVAATLHNVDIRTIRMDKGHVERS
jgi:hypothetical protein